MMWTYPQDAQRPPGRHVWTYPKEIKIPEGGLALTTWGDVCLFRGTGLYSLDTEGIWILCTDPRDGALQIGARDLQCTNVHRIT